MARWKPFAAVAAVALLATAPGVFAQTATPLPPPRNTTPYPEMVRTNFMAGCLANGKVPQALCACMLRNVERQMTLEEFMAFDKQSAEDPNAPAPPVMHQIALACVADTNS